MRRLFARQLALVSTLGALSCGAPPVVSVSLDVAAGAPNVSDLYRYRMVVRRCSDERLAFTGDIDPSSTETNRTDAPIPPGEPFYVWVQGWGACDTNACSPDNTADDDACRCFGELEPSFQKLTVEACTDWLVTSSSQELSLSLDRPSTRCPPARPPDCDDLK